VDNVQKHNDEWDEDRLKVCEDTLLGGRRKLHDEELHNLYSTPSIIRMIK
jgi:hypothetical protein